ncbi:hypothetical protein [Paenibacillus sp. 32O-W]|uniref:hypothetical protein n=1 Tax=Paenibacillus sp. 32O-W TaxID=1695218 RepID=UPI0016432ACF|nr:MULTISPECIES: hypothetical protein [Paenibacillaceae]
MTRLFLSGFVIVLLVITGCRSSEETEHRPSSAPNPYEELNRQKDEVKEGDFVYRLVTEKSEYRGEEPVVLYAELEYVGDKKEVTIYHAASPFYFPMTEKTRGYSIEYSMPQPLVSTTLKQGEPIREDYSKSGGYSQEDDPQYIAFIKKLWDSGFPAGYYVVDGVAEFWIELDKVGQDNEEYRIKAEIDFKVVE